MNTGQRVTVIGLGYVGLPLLLEATRQGFVCTGLDIEADVVATLNAGRSHIDDISDAELASAVAAGLRATIDGTCLADADVAIICVPTPLDAQQTPDLRAVEAASRAIATHLHPGMLVVLESTTYPGTTDTLVRGILEQSGLRAGVDFALAFSP